MRIIPSMGIAKTCANLANCGNRGMMQWRNGPRKPACFQQSWTLEILEGFTSDVCVVPDPPNPYNDRSTMVKLMDYMTFAKPIVAFDLPDTVPGFHDPDPEPIFVDARP